MGSWRKPRGVDCVDRRKFRGRVRMPTIGSKQARRTRHLLPSGLKKLLIRNESDMELLLMHNRTYCGEIAQGISALKRKCQAEEGLRRVSWQYPRREDLKLVG